MPCKDDQAALQNPGKVDRNVPVTAMLQSTLERDLQRNSALAMSSMLDLN